MPPTRHPLVIMKSRTGAAWTSLLGHLLFDWLAAVAGIEFSFPAHFLFSFPPFSILAFFSFLARPVNSLLLLNET